MKRPKFSDEQIAYALSQAEGGTAVADVCGSRASAPRNSRAVRQCGIGDSDRIRAPGESTEGSSAAQPAGPPMPKAALTGHFGPG